MKKPVELAYEYYMKNLHVSKTEACKMFGIDGSYLTQHIKRKGLEDKDINFVGRPKGLEKPYIPKSKQAYDMLLKGCTQEEIYRKTKYTLFTIKKYAEKHGLEFPSGIHKTRNRVARNHSDITKEAYEWKEKTGETYKVASEKFGISEGSIKMFKKNSKKA